MKKNNKGFTIVELVIVIAVIAILAAVLIPTFSNVLDKAKESSAMQQAKAEWELYLAEELLDIEDSDDYVIIVDLKDSDGSTEKTLCFTAKGTQFKTESDTTIDATKYTSQTDLDLSKDITDNNVNVKIYKKINN